MNILVCDGGARGHAMYNNFVLHGHQAWVTPRNGGVVPKWCCDVGLGDIDGLVRLIKEKKIDMVVCGPEAMLCSDVADTIRKEVPGVVVAGPSKAAAQLEGSKIFCTELCMEIGVRVPRSRIGSSPLCTKNLLSQSWGTHPVVKADGLCGGKGVVVSDSLEEGLEFVDATHKTFGEAGSRYVLQERIVGKEISAMFFVDGEGVVRLRLARDHKRLLAGDRGPNTGGMGAGSPLLDITSEMMERIEREFALPIVRAMKARGTPYHGVLYLGLMLTADGVLYLIEINVRFGDPEIAALLALYRSDLAMALWATTRPGGLATLPRIEWGPGVAVAFVMAAQEYPGGSHSALPITITHYVGCTILHAGTERRDDGTLWVKKGAGRILNVVVTAPTYAEARRIGLDQIKQIHWAGAQWRDDIMAASAG